MIILVIVSFKSASQDTLEIGEKIKEAHKYTLENKINTNKLNFTEAGLIYLANNVSFLLIPGNKEHNKKYVFVVILFIKNSIQKGTLITFENHNISNYKIIKRSIDSDTIWVFTAKENQHSKTKIFGGKVLLSESINYTTKGDINPPILGISANENTSVNLNPDTFISASYLFESNYKYFLDIVKEDKQNKFIDSYFNINEIFNPSIKGTTKLITLHKIEFEKK
jgi:hypothetical protein